MEREVVITGDGSSTIHLPQWNEQYHSKHGAIQEAYHVFIKYGLHHYCYSELDSESQLKVVSKGIQTARISILEIGFGTGLNAFITLLEAEKLKCSIDYYGVEGYPVEKEEVVQLNYPEKLDVASKENLFINLHDVSWEDQHSITPNFSLTKQNRFFSEIKEKEQFNIIYFDAFGARVQPELWTEDIFQKMYEALQNNGVLVTYAAKGSVRRAMQTVGFSVEKLPGPPGKREMLRATKKS
ncbi:tRNA (5-methylaminomethyl-2-thiouridine)(34)-methyltransferase MnmD [Aestuariibaculum sp. YM273]|uniref:tRNA (5-methylaminomethyl-2-thiouridine)(34)-methyltransferase MnmD n=1 Tax=Aestuariibaculum sp. YM273 TaxID=3070659 RepID=UPI0027DDA0F7|nr:tRNA (5-methylaminomethyl-2-thiouridine)(34)-methyltransferase MnmD [Aestuariibaculum sp. YM273]WMI65660.1 tRNA (5-methylaminomethyl-2-thiouridine)(34)-methyltransferase MnmD [Aestuariibaculum sp. YM273]